MDIGLKVFVTLNEWISVFPKKIFFSKRICLFPNILRVIKIGTNLEKLNFRKPNDIVGIFLNKRCKLKKSNLLLKKSNLQYLLNSVTKFKSFELLCLFIYLSYFLEQPHSFFKTILTNLTNPSFRTKILFC